MSTDLLTHSMGMLTDLLTHILFYLFTSSKGIYKQSLQICLFSQEITTSRDLGLLLLFTWLCELVLQPFFFYLFIMVVVGGIGKRLNRKQPAFFAHNREKRRPHIFFVFLVWVYCVSRWTSVCQSPNSMSCFRSGVLKNAYSVIVSVRQYAVVRGYARACTQVVFLTPLSCQRQLAMSGGTG